MTNPTRSLRNQGLARPMPRRTDSAPKVTRKKGATPTTIRANRSVAGRDVYRDRPQIKPQQTRSKHRENPGKRPHLTRKQESGTDAFRPRPTQSDKRRMPANVAGRSTPNRVKNRSDGRGGQQQAKRGDYRRPNRAQAHRDFDRHHKAGNYHRLANSHVGRKVALHKQWSHHHKGDVARRMHLHSHLKKHGGWHRRHVHGPVGRHYLRHHFTHHYLGPHRYPRYTWYPRWYGWVNWSWSVGCDWDYDPRPVVVRPLAVEAGPEWAMEPEEQPAAWQPLFAVASGTWVDVPLPELIPGSVDVQLLAVRFVDPGHPEKNLGPRYRVWLRNNGGQPIEAGFNVLALASADERATQLDPQATVRVERVAASAIQAVDIRLPVRSATMDIDEQGRATPFSFLRVIIDSHGEVARDAIPTNNGAVVRRLQVLPVDPAIFQADKNDAAVGSVVNLAGEGFGPEPGQVVVSVGELQLNAQIEGWYDLGIRVQLPALQLAAAQEVKLLVIRGDGAASNPLPFTLLSGDGAGLPPAEPKEDAEEPERLEF